MWNPLALLIAAIIAATLAGCAAPAAPAAMKLTRVAAARQAPVSVQVRVTRPATYKTQAVVAAYTSADIDHVVLAVYRAGGATAVTTLTRSAASLATIVTISNLRAGTAYEVRATAYADAAETTVISDATGCATTFTTPSVATVEGVSAVDDAAVTLVALALKLKDTTFAGSAAFTLSFDSTFADADAIDQVRVRLVAVGGDGSETEKIRTTYDLASVNAGQTLSVGQLRSGTTYRAYADGLRSADGTTASDPTKSTVTFTTSTVVNGQADDAVGTLTLPLAL